MNENDAPGLFDRLDPNSSIRAGPRENDREIIPSLRRKRTEKQIDRGSLPAGLLELGKRKVLIGNGHLPVGRDHIDMLCFELNPIRYLGDGHLRPGREDGGQLALMRRVKMDDDNEGRVDVVRQVLEKLLQGVHAAG